MQDRLDPHLMQSFTVARSPHDALDAAQAYLEGIGMVNPRLQGRMERYGDSLAIHHGRIRTTMTATGQATPADEGPTKVLLHRRGQAPLEQTRRWLIGVGLGGFLVAWALTVYNERAAAALPPLFTISIFLLGVVLILAVLFTADRSLERRSESIVLSLEDAIRGDPLAVLQREIDALERSSSLVNGLIFYCAALLVEFLVFAIVLSDGIRQGIDEVAALGALRFGFLIPILPALAFAGAYFVWVNQLHERRMHLAHQRLGALARAA